MQCNKYHDIVREELAEIFGRLERVYKKKSPIGYEFEYESRYLSNFTKDNISSGLEDLVAKGED